MSYLKSAPTRRRTPQTTPLPGQVENSAGGGAWAVAPLARLRRFLVLGSEGGSYYASERDLTAENVACLAECDPLDAVRTIADVSRGGLAARNDPALYALAYYAAHEDARVRSFALDHLSDVARTGTHLMRFADFIQSQRGWGRSLRRAVGGWYQDKPADRVAYQAVKYRQRHGFTHRDLLRLSHPEAPTPGHRMLFDWIAHPDARRDPDFPDRDLGDELRILEGFERAQAARSHDETASLIREYRLPHEAILTEHKGSRAVWAALLEDMPATALICNLPTMTRVGLIEPMSDGTQAALEKLADHDWLCLSRVHPFQVLVAALTYAGGRSLRGSSTWTPVPQVVDALDAAFYGTFAGVEPTGRRTLLALDVSGSMGSPNIMGVPGLSPYVGSAAMALVTAAVEPRHEIVAFTERGACRRVTRFRGYYERGSAISPVPISPGQRLGDVVATLRGMAHGMGGTDCALPWIYAREQGRQVDVAVTYTDSETWAGDTHPTQELDRYRRETGVDARAVVCAMVANEFSVADPADTRQLDVVGFDASTPKIIADFSAGRL